MLSGVPVFFLFGNPSCFIRYIVCDIAGRIRELWPIFGLGGGQQASLPSLRFAHDNLIQFVWGSPAAPIRPLI